MPDASQGRRTVLITRPAAEAANTAGRVTGLGFLPLVAPFLTIRPAKPALPAGTQATLVTSGNALAALMPGDAPLLAVGDATAARAVSMGFSRVHSAGRDAAAMAELAVRLLNPAHGPLLLASGAGQGGALAADLRARGFRVQRRVCYESVTVRRFPHNAASALRQNTVHAVLFMSAETARSFARLLPAALHPALGGVLALTIGNAAADALNELPWRGIRRAATPTLDDVLALL